MRKEAEGWFYVVTLTKEGLMSGPSNLVYAENPTAKSRCGFWELITGRCR